MLILKRKLKALEFNNNGRVKIVEKVDVYLANIDPYMYWFGDICLFEFVLQWPIIMIVVIGSCLVIVAKIIVVIIKVFIDSLPIFTDKFNKFICCQFCHSLFCLPRKSYKLK